MGFKFSSSSADKLKSCHIDLQKVINLAISRSNIDFGISQGERSVKTQQEYYAIGRTVEKHKSTITNIDGVKKLSKHNHSPSQAVDIYVYHSDASTRTKIIYDTMHLSYIAGLIDSCAQELLAKKEITHKVRWGGNWDSDGIIVYDQSLNDLPHFEIVK
jgi:peptidoglycan L-alanyl-D-glutamate endopeptidase CwlK